MKKRIIWIDMLRIISMMGVIIMHVVGNTINTFNLGGSPKEVFYIISKIFYFSIPLFVMISGMLFLDKDIDIKNLFNKYIKRIVLVILLFGSIFSGLEIFFDTHCITIDYIPKIINNILTGNLWAHMWYLYMILGLYMLTPLFRTWIKNSDMKQQRYLLILLYIFTILVPTINNYFNITIAFNLPISGYIFVYLLGYYIYKNNQTDKEKNLIYILGIISLITIIIFPKLAAKDIIGYTSTSTIMVATSIFVFFKNIKLKQNEKLEKIVSSLGTASFGIYILHQFYINIIYKLLKIKLILLYPYAGLVFYSLVILLITYLTVYLLRKIPIVKKYLF